MNNLELYEKVRRVPESAKRPIDGGKLKGKTDINPMWRIKTLTEQFGACGTGWFYVPVKRWTENGANGEVAVFVDIELYVKHENEWSKPICGTGGAMLISVEKGQLVTNDEAYKMANTDAISVAAKQLGIGADVYWTEDATKYTQKPAEKKADYTTADIAERAESKREKRKSRAETINEYAKKYGIESGRVKDIVYKYVPDGILQNASDTAFNSILCELKDESNAT